MPDDYALLAIDLGDVAVEEQTHLPTDPAAFGGAWLAGQRTPVLQVLSVIVPESPNILLNPAHPDAGGPASFAGVGSRSTGGFGFLGDLKREAGVQGLFREQQGKVEQP